MTKSYIKAWADERNVVDVLDVDEGRGYPSAIGDASVVSYDYDPNAFRHDLEGAFSVIEGSGIAAIRKLRAGEEMSRPDLTAVIAFLDMHLHRGRYANRVSARQPALLFIDDESVQEAELNYGDLLSLAHDHPDTLRLTSLELEQRAWKIYPFEGLWTGDGAVLLFALGGGQEPTSIAFPLSPTQLLVIGDDLPEDVNMNRLIGLRSRRWVVGQRGTLPIEAVKRIKAQCDAEAGPAQ
ncbi:hypothetical protein [Microbacterium natoriense]|uniref:hypothetical protein n=1 Tax=Microbacterium natoriense TaxID=284570 RepID=UPI0027D8412A|nr:hypothetical protein [Microbacterium natoriense]